MGCMADGSTSYEDLAHQDVGPIGANASLTADVAGIADVEFLRAVIRPGQQSGTTPRLIEPWWPECPTAHFMAHRLAVEASDQVR